jgi:hypothetical protein
MQGLPLKAPEHFDYGFTRSLWQGQAPSGKMHTNLVGSPCFQRHTDVGKGPESLQDRVVGYGGLAVLLNTHALAVHRMPPDGLILIARYLSFRQLAHQCRVGRQRLGYQQESGRILVDTMDDPGPRHLFKLRRMVQEAVHERTARITRSRVDDQSGRFIDWFRAYLALGNGLELNGFAA